MALSTSDVQQPGIDPLNDQRLAHQQVAGVKRDLVTITVDGNEYQVLRGAHSMASLTKTAVLVDPPNFLGAQRLHSRKGQLYQAQDTINIEGGEVFTSSTTGAPSPRGFNRPARPSHVLDERTDEQRAADQDCIKTVV